MHTLRTSPSVVPTGRLGRKGVRHLVDKDVASPVMTKFSYTLRLPLKVPCMAPAYTWEDNMASVKALVNRRPGKLQSIRCS